MNTALDAYSIKYYTRNIFEILTIHSCSTSLVAKSYENLIPSIYSLPADFIMKHSHEHIPAKSCNMNIKRLSDLSTQKLINKMATIITQVEKSPET